MFFVLSGFLVSGLLFTEFKSRHCFSIVRFYMRRGWKILPPFATLIAATLIFSLLSSKQVRPLSLGAEVLFIQNYLPGLWNHTWSLAVEQHFYLLLPLVLTCILRWIRSSSIPLRLVFALEASVAVGGLLLRLLNWRIRPEYSHLTHLYPSHLRLDALFFGVAISYAYHFHTNQFIVSLTPWRRWLVISGVLLLTPAFVFQLETTPFIFTAGLTLFYLGSGMLLVGILLCDLAQNRITALVAILGSYSYSIYLWHMAVRNWGVPLVKKVCGLSLGFGCLTMVYLVGSLATGVLMAKIIEVPSLKLRDRWFPPRNQDVIEPSPQSTPMQAGPEKLCNPQSNYQKRKSCAIFGIKKG